MGKPKKSTKKFAQKQLKGAIQHKKRHQHHKRVKGAHGSSGAGAAAAAAQQEPTAQQKPLEEMDLDEFLDGGFTAYGGAAAAAGGSSSDEEGQELSSGSGQEDMEEGDSEGLSEDEAALLAGMANGHAKPPSKQTSQQQQKAAKKQPAAAEEQGGDSSSEDEEEEAAAAAAGGKGEDYQAVAADSNRLKGQISKHRQQLEALRTKDPEFYKYLQQTDAQLLGFGEGEEEEEGMEDLSESSDEGSDSEDAQEQPASAAAAKKQKQKQAAAAADSEEEEDEAGSEDEEAAAAAAEPGYNVTSEMLDSWCKAALKNPTPGTVKHLVQAYRAACHYGDSEAGLDTTLRISSSAVFNRVLLFMLREADGLFRRMLGLPLDAATAAPAAAAAGGAGPGPSSTGQQQQQGGKGAKGALLLGPQVSKAPRWRKVEGLVKSYLGNTLHLLGQMTEPAMLAFLLRRLRASAAFLGPFDKIQRKLLKAALQVFGTAEHGPRVQALLFVRQLALVLPPPAMERCMSGVYRSYASNAKFMSAANLPHLTFMASAMVEMTSLDLGTAYQVAFEAIKQLAVLLRNALQQKTKDAFKEVYCWQAINCMELWVKVVSAHAGRGELQPLVYPLAQLLLGAARLVPTPRYFPLRLRLIRAINRLAQATQVYIPVSPLLLEMLHWAELKKRPSGSTGAAPDMLLLLRLSKVQLRSAAVQEEVVQQVLELLADHLRQWALSIAFPELAHLPFLALRGYAKASPVERFRRHSKSLADAVARNTTWVGAARDAVAYAPHDLGAVAGFLAGQEAKSPLQQYAAHLLVRAQARMAMRSTATDSLGVKEQQAGKRKRQQQQEDESSDEEEGGSEEDAEQQQQAAKKRKQQQKQEQKEALLAALQAEGGALAADDMLQDYQLSDEEEEEEEEEGSEEGAAAGGGSSSGSEGEEEEDGSGSEEDEELGAGVFAGEEDSEEEEEGEEVSGSEAEEDEMSSDEEGAGMQRPRQQQGRQMQQQGHQKPQHHQQQQPRQQQQQHRSPGGGGGKPWGNSPRANGVAGGRGGGRGGHQHHGDQRQPQQHGGRGGGGGFGKPQHQRGGGRGGGRGRGGGSPGGGRAGGGGGGRGFGGGGRGARGFGGGGGGGRGRGGSRGGSRGGGRGRR